MGRPLQLPGILGALAEAQGGLQNLSTALCIPARTLQHWAANTRATDAVMAHARLRLLAEALKVKPILYRAPGGELVESTVYGYIDRNERWMGDPRTLIHAAP